MTADLLLAFSAGALSFFAPCVVPLLPAYVSYLGGATLRDIQADPSAFQRRVVSGGLLYVAGFAAVFVVLGVAAGVLGHSLLSSRALLQRVGGVLVILMGLALLGLLPGGLAGRGFNLLGGGSERIRAAATGGGPEGAAAPRFAPLLLGIVFGTAWTPCVGPVLGSILLLAAARGQALAGGLLLAAYTAGLGLPFILCSLLVAGFPAVARPLSRFAGVLGRAAGLLLVLLGVLLVTGAYQSLSGYLAQPFTLR